MTMDLFYNNFRSLGKELEDMYTKYLLEVENCQENGDDRNDDNQNYQNNKNNCNHISDATSVDNVEENDENQTASETDHTLNGNQYLKNDDHFENNVGISNGDGEQEVPLSNTKTWSEIVLEESLDEAQKINLNNSTTNNYNMDSGHRTRHYSSSTVGGDLDDDRLSLRSEGGSLKLYNVQDRLRQGHHRINQKFPREGAAEAIRRGGRGRGDIAVGNGTGARRKVLTTTTHRTTGPWVNPRCISNYSHTADRTRCAGGGAIGGNNDQNPNNRRNQYNTANNGNHSDSNRGGTVNHYRPQYDRPPRFNRNYQNRQQQQYQPQPQRSSSRSSNYSNYANRRSSFSEDWETPNPRQTSSSSVACLSIPLNNVYYQEPELLTNMEPAINGVAQQQQEQHQHQQSRQSRYNADSNRNYNNSYSSSQQQQSLAASNSNLYRKRGEYNFSNRRANVNSEPNRQRPASTGNYRYRNQSWDRDTTSIASTTRRYGSQNNLECEFHDFNNLIYPAAAASRPWERHGRRGFTQNNNYSSSNSKQQHHHHHQQQTNNSSPPSPTNK